MQRVPYPEIEPYDTGFLQVSKIHSIYYEQCGNPKGKPALFVHGGPGGGCRLDDRRFFDPDAYRIVLVDQRGSGRSRPFACLEENTTWDLVADIERVRERLAIERWLVFGGSWGSTLSLAYAVNYPSRVSELVLRGIFLGSKTESDWLYQRGASVIMPDVWEDFLAPIPEDERSDLPRAYYGLLTSDDEATRVEAARAWSLMEGRSSYLLPNEEAIEEYGDPDLAVAMARIECHYFINGCFFPSDHYLLENIHKIASIPGIIVQGRYDLVCPIEAAWKLHRAWPGADIRIVPDAGHSATEPGTTHELLQATDGFRA